MRAGPSEDAVVAVECGGPVKPAGGGLRGGRLAYETPEATANRLASEVRFVVCGRPARPRTSACVFVCVCVCSCVFGGLGGER